MPCTNRISPGKHQLVARRIREFLELPCRRRWMLLTTAYSGSALQAKRYQKCLKSSYICIIPYTPYSTCLARFLLYDNFTMNKIPHAAHAHFCSCPVLLEIAALRHSRKTEAQRRLHVEKEQSSLLRSSCILLEQIMLFLCSLIY